LPITVNLGSGSEISVGAIVELIAQAIGRSVDIITETPRQRPDSSEVDRLVADAGRARELLGWSAETSLHEGLKETIAWFDKNLDSYRPHVYQI
jgi:nucleoside-diphosphate-sugar epimerase